MRREGFSWAEPPSSKGPVRAAQTFVAGEGSTDLLLPRFPRLLPNYVRHGRGHGVVGFVGEGRESETTGYEAFHAAQTVVAGEGPTNLLLPRVPRPLPNHLRELQRLLRGVRTQKLTKFCGHIPKS